MVIRRAMRRVAVVLLHLVVLSACAWAQESGYGVGVLLGEPTGLSGKAWVSGQNAIDGGLAYSFRSKGCFHIHGDYLWHFPDVIQSAERFPLYAGIGGRIATGKGGAIFGVRIPLGVAFWVRSAPIELFLEVAPILDLAPATEFSANAGLGARFYF
ncbi:MAG TPA: hypothetical protein DGH68_00855, partial [Bacteroidetes bacterium]|nr:hypothetical protein [Bacteroidota bacterium]